MKDQLVEKIRKSNLKGVPFSLMMDAFIKMMLTSQDLLLIGTPLAYKGDKWIFGSIHCKIDDTKYLASFQKPLPSPYVKELGNTVYLIQENDPNIEFTDPVRSSKKHLIFALKHGDYSNISFEMVDKIYNYLGDIWK